MTLNGHLTLNSVLALVRLEFVREFFFSTIALNLIELDPYWQQ